MANHFALLAMLFMLSASGMATMWAYHDPMFFQTGYSHPAPSYPQANMSILEIEKDPYFGLLGQSFYTNAIPVNLTNSTNTIRIGSKSPAGQGATPVTFGEHLENNLRYARSHSSLRIGRQGSWGTLNTPGLV